ESGEAWEGAMSGHLHANTRVGSIIKVGAPSGSFIIPEHSEQPIVLFAGGIGITPFLSYLESLLDAPDMPEVWLHYANRNRLSTMDHADRTGSGGNPKRGVGSPAQKQTAGVKEGWPRPPNKARKEASERALWRLVARFLRRLVQR